MVVCVIFYFCLFHQVGQFIFLGYVILRNHHEEANEYALKYARQFTEIINNTKEAWFIFHISKTGFYSFWKKNWLRMVFSWWKSLAVTQRFFWGWMSKENNLYKYIIFFTCIRDEIISIDLLVKVNCISSSELTIRNKQSVGGTILSVSSSDCDSALR